MDLVRLELLEAVQPALLQRFLQPFAEYLGERGIRLQGAALDDAWLGNRCTKTRS
jgi:hypothetical protein